MNFCIPLPFRRYPDKSSLEFGILTNLISPDTRMTCDTRKHTPCPEIPVGNINGSPIITNLQKDMFFYVLGLKVNNRSSGGKILEPVYGCIV